MSEPSYLEEYCNMCDAAISDFITAFGREPSEDELEEEIEALLDRYR